MITFEYISAFFIVLLAICGAVITVGGAVEVIRRFRKPGQNVAATVEDHSKMLANDHTRISEMEKGQALILKGTMQLLNHGVHGNHVEQMAETHDEIQEYLINR